MPKKITPMPPVIEVERSPAPQPVPKEALTEISQELAALGKRLRSVGQAVDSLAAGRGMPDNVAALESWPLWPSLRRFLLKHGRFEGPLAYLLVQLGRDYPTGVPAGWPTTPHKVGSDLRRLAGALRRAGYEAEFVKRNRFGCRWSLRLLPEVSTATTLTA